VEIGAYVSSTGRASTDGEIRESASAVKFDPLAVAVPATRLHPL
jgi:hypothetical protein